MGMSHWVATGLASCFAVSAFGQPVLEQGLQAELLGNAGGANPIMDWIPTPAFGSGLMVGTTDGAGVTLSVMDEDGLLAAFTTISGTGASDVRFDRGGGFNGELLVTTRASGTRRARVRQFDAMGIQTATNAEGGPANQLRWFVDIVSPGTIYQPGPGEGGGNAFLVDADPDQGIQYWSFAPSGNLSQLPSLSSVSDANGVEFDRNGDYGGRLLGVSAAGLFAIDGGFNEALLQPANGESFFDLTQTRGGTFGQFVYVASFSSGTVFRMKTDGTREVVATGFDPIFRLASDEAGDRIFIGETDGDVWVLSAEPEPCVVDLTTSGTNPGDPDYGVPDGQVTAADLTCYVELWLNGCP
ncbi:MAG: hypothetical protein AAGG07_10765 [Planctomycetota bacterium]